MIKNISAQASKAFKSARISTNIHKSASAKVSRSVTTPSQASDVRNTFYDGNSTTSDKVISSLNLDDYNPSAVNVNRNISVNAILSQKLPVKIFVQPKPHQKIDGQPSYGIAKILR